MKCSVGCCAVLCSSSEVFVLLCSRCAAAASLSLRRWGGGDRQLYWRSLRLSPPLVLSVREKGLALWNQVAVLANYGERRPGVVYWPTKHLAKRPGDADEVYLSPRLGFLATFRGISCGWNHNTELKIPGKGSYQIQSLLWLLWSELLYKPTKHGPHLYK